MCRSAQQLRLENDHEKLTAMLGHILKHVKVKKLSAVHNCNCNQCVLCLSRPIQVHGRFWRQWMPPKHPSTTK